MKTITTVTKSRGGRWLATGLVSLPFFVLLVLLCAGSAGAGGSVPPGANPHLLVTPLEVWENREHWLIIDLRDRESYLEGHVPGAIHLGDRGHKMLREDRYILFYGDQDIDPKQGKLIEHLEPRPVAELEQVFAAAGVTREHTVILYSDLEDTLPGYTFVPFVILEYLGHEDVRVMDGGIENWWAHRLPLGQGENRLPPSDFRARLQPQVIAHEAEVLRLARFNPSYLQDIGVNPHQFELPQLVDVRVDVEHSGAQPAPPGHFLYDSVIRTGRIPHTIANVPHWQQFADFESLRLKPIAELDAMYGDLDRHRRTIVYCYIANRASMSYFVLRLLGFSDPAVYHDSWIIWGNNPRLPLVRDRGVEVARTPLAGGY
ncbi:sulfurtransferase [Desulfurivibrio alkaliphilus]|uniref:Rhodanese domain protein n=1 Tax=Desulfurivibrio alkaliphilus (strain DSM 19089 / UNIQEM U267 / AHT2) TaxID=589865 RepID=D6Z432_DESAT|nr:rhodanese-like domain-containing protein [Desulfurivibrio alkaliphilus]ADH86307.1 Rhodanese domain protein [Desulfurivibrio alkaliphilus AHT 2]